MGDFGGKGVVLGVDLFVASVVVPFAVPGVVPVVVPGAGENPIGDTVARTFGPGTNPLAIPSPLETPGITGV